MPSPLSVVLGACGVGTIAALAIAVLTAPHGPDFLTMSDPIARYDVPPAPEYPHGNSAWHDADSTPTSTFALDTDAATWTILQRHRLGGPGVRADEVINAFAYDDHLPRTGDLAVTTELAASPLERDEVLLRVGVRARSAVETRAPANVTFLVDVSGSMADAIDRVRTTLHAVIEQLRPDDTLTLVQYADDATVALGTAPVGDRVRGFVAVNGLRAYAGTNHQRGLLTAYRLVEQSQRPGSHNWLVWCTDGETIAWADESLAEIAAWHRRHGVDLTIVSTGLPSADARLDEIASRAGGAYAAVITHDDARRVGSAPLEVVARDARIQVTFAPEVVSAWRRVGPADSFYGPAELRDDEIARDLRAGAQASGVYALKLHPGRHGTVANVSTSHRTDEGLLITQEHQVTTDVLTDRPSPSLGLAVAAARYAEALQPVAGSPPPVEDDARGARAPSGRSRCGRPRHTPAHRAARIDRSGGDAGGVARGAGGPIDRCIGHDTPSCRIHRSVEGVMTRTLIRTYSRTTQAALELLGKQIRAARKERRMSEHDLAERASIARSTLQRLERGDPRVEIGVVFEAATLVGVELFGDEGPSVRRLARMDDRLAVLPKAVRKVVWPGDVNDF